MKKIYLLLFLFINLTVFSQQNCNIGDMEVVENSSFSFPVGANYLVGNVIAVDNPVEITALTVLVSTNIGQGKMHLYKRTGERTGSFVVSSNSATLVSGLNTFAVTPTNIVAGEYFIFVNSNQYPNQYFTEPVTNVSDYPMYEVHRDFSATGTENLNFNNYANFKMLLGMVANCESASTPTCSVNQFNRENNFANSVETFSYMVPFTLDDPATIENFKVKNVSDQGQFKVAIYRRDADNIQTLVAVTNLTNAVTGIQTVLPVSEVTLPPGDYFSVLVGNQNYRTLFYNTNSISDMYVSHLFENGTNLPNTITNLSEYTNLYYKFPVETNFVCATAGLSDFDQASIKIYPNPAQDQILISGLKETTAYTVFNLLGAKVGTGIINEQNSIPVSHLAKGMYVIKLDGGQTLKFIKE